MGQIAFVAGSNGPPWSIQLTYAEKDAIQLGVCLTQKCNYKIYGAPEGGDAHDTMREIARVAASCMPGDDLVIYFSGHGELVNGRLFLLWGQTSEAIFDSAINARQIIDTMELSLATNKLLILDCCHAGGAVGFRGGNLQPLLAESGSQSVLCASSRLEQAREFSDLDGSFLAHHACQILASDARSHVTLSDLEGELRRRAVDHNAGNPRFRVPIPYLFGEPKPFFVKRPSGRACVQIRLLSLFEPDMAILRDTLQAYRKWDVGQILRGLPVQVTLPPEFTERVLTLSRYLETDTWPCTIEERTRDQVRFFVERLIPDFTNDLIRAVRAMMAASILPDGSSVEAARDSILESYLSAKTFSTLRVVQAMRLLNEPEPTWVDQFRELDTAWSNDLIFGLTWTTQRNRNFSFWTDADWRIDSGTAVRVFVPQTVGYGQREFESLDKQDYWRIMLPQLLEKEPSDGSLYASIHRLITGDHSVAFKGIHVRGELFIETESHNAAIGSPDAKIRATRIVAEHLAVRLRAVSKSDRRRAFFEMVPLPGILKELPLKVRELLPELSADLLAQSSGEILRTTAGSDKPTIRPTDVVAPASGSEISHPSQALAEFVASKPWQKGFGSAPDNPRKKRPKAKK
jgi:Caspase domain